jgi:uncharacterized protein (DUF362 family)
MSKVSIIKGLDPIETTFKALDKIRTDIDKALSDTKSIMIKPNYINSRHPSTGITTDGRVVEGVVKFLKKIGREDVIIGEGCGWGDTFRAFKNADLISVSERWNIKLVDLNKDEFVEVNPPNPISLKKVRVAKTALKNTIISVPKLKPHRSATVTLSLKNMMGALASKGVMHNGYLSSNIVDLASVLKPSISVVDGIIAGQGHELKGDPIEMNIIITGTDPVAVDAVGAAIMGIRPTDVKHLVLAERKGLGTMDLKRIEILGEALDDVKKKFHRS